MKHEAANWHGPGWSAVVKWGGVWSEDKKKRNWEMEEREIKIMKMEMRGSKN